MTASSDAHHKGYEVEASCSIVPSAPFTCRERVAQHRDPSWMLARAQGDLALPPEILCVFAGNFGLYGLRKV